MGSRNSNRRKRIPPRLKKTRLFETLEDRLALSGTPPLEMHLADGPSVDMPIYAHQ